MEQFQGVFSAIVVLMMLAGALVFLRSRGVARFQMPNVRGGSATRRLQSIERLPLTAQHSLHLVRVGDREVLIAVSPSGCAVVDGQVAGILDRGLRS